MLPWTERVTIMSIDPDEASSADVARLASELMAAREALTKIKTWCELNACRGSVVHDLASYILEAKAR